MEKEIKIVAPDGYHLVETKTFEGVSVRFEKDSLSKEQEMKEFLKPFLTNLLITHHDDGTNSVFFEQNGETLFELYQDSKNKETRYFYVHYYKIWSVFESKFGLNYDETQSFIKSVVEDTLKIGSVTPCGMSFQCCCMVEDTLKIGSVTPFCSGYKINCRWKTP